MMNKIYIKNKGIIILTLSILFFNCELVFKNVRSNEKISSFKINNFKNSNKKINCKIKIYHISNIYGNRLEIIEKNKELQNRILVKESLDSIKELELVNSFSSRDLDYFCEIRISKNRIFKNLILDTLNGIVSSLSLLIIPLRGTYNDSIDIKILNIKEGKISQYNRNFEYNFFVSSFIFLAYYYDRDKITEKVYIDEINKIFIEYLKLN
ncbi:MAG: hypothetical protein O9346_07820 [Leptospiraceae bacterium]|nr:hypothetical protein [Leptospiraceae bacterium]MCZ8346307.1 hypothetical protein [Leptospiraceae bacterium]